jgi:cytochrome c biogenesis protein CcmG/thiol:disulfide interchange protein DsbE
VWGSAGDLGAMAGDPHPVRLQAVLLPGALLAAAALVVVLGVQLRAARAELQAEKRRSVLPAPGQVVPAVRARTLSGDSVLLGEGPPGTRQVLSIFNTRCGICVATLPAWERVHEQLASDSDASVVGWSQDGDSVTRAYVQAHQVGYPVVVGLPAKYLKLYHGWGVPATLVVDAEGTVLYGRPGLLSEAAVDSIMTAVRAAR